jgi:hypothetical protein
LIQSQGSHLPIRSAVAGFQGFEKDIFVLVNHIAAGLLNLVHHAGLDGRSWRDDPIAMDKAGQVIATGEVYPLLKEYRWKLNSHKNRSIHA